MDVFRSVEVEELNLAAGHKTDANKNCLVSDSEAFSRTNAQRVVRDPGLLIDDDLSMEEYISSTCRPCLPTTSDKRHTAKFIVQLPMWTC